ncbi:hypothetical protein [Sphingobium sp. CCH11-B1]|jgi:hypothetical protein|uniref:hypothetical protein n=1 Tax=Sphingobium sp. CCH11-B1 TaxID=1768781 RepID=UPI0008320C34|nr:hypothetical protein [Sphingobium sp. CCH11-B1]MEA3390544.1 hypothetical protein [Pseudomonadota bacterium]
MKAMRYALLALVFYAALWGAAHVGMLPGLHSPALGPVALTAEQKGDRFRALRRYLPIIR